MAGLRDIRGGQSGGRGGGDVRAPVLPGQQSPRGECAIGMMPRIYFFLYKRLP